MGSEGHGVDNNLNFVLEYLYKI